jgi:hypothetical protein
MNLGRRLLSLRNKWRRLRAFAPLRAMGFLIQAAVLAKAQRRKGRKEETPTTGCTTNSSMDRSDF